MGGIRFGFSDDERARFRSEADFKAAYLASVQAYQRVRQHIDARLDQLRLRDGVAIDAPVLAAQTKSWVNELGEQLRREEAEARAAMERFTAIRPIGVGDVIQVPCYTPHSLLHGVRTVEFQTPVYERLILSFAQKVLTQPSWDTEDAVAKMTTAAPDSPVFDRLFDDDGVLVERIVDFIDFEVFRYRLESGAQISLATTSYAVVMGVQGELLMGGQRIEPEQAALLPASCSGFKITNCDVKKLCFLVAVPKTSILDSKGC
jgi:mannose-6-phosphate isomerase class I